MRIFSKKNVIKRIMLIILLVMLSTLIIPNNVKADVTTVDIKITDEDEIPGGTLLTPIKLLVRTIGDAAMFAIQGIVIRNAEWMTFSVTPEDKSGNYWDDLGDDAIQYPGFLMLTPEAIFSNKVSILNPDFIHEIDTEGTIEKKSNGDTDPFGGENPYEDSLKELRKTISKWYIGLRNLALVGLLSVLVYIGIRIIISSTAGEKAKYKQMIMYWVTAICLLFVLHYIMSFTFVLTNKFTELFTGSSGSNIIKTLEVGPSKTFTINDSDKQKKFEKFLDAFYSAEKGDILNGDKIIGVANMMQFARLYSNLTAGASLGYLIIYIALVGYTVYFFLVYTKRVIYVAFLTLIAPLITLTYPIDKLNDGQSQAFNTWLKEFVFNILIQPFHLLIYTVFVGSAINFATTNMIYTIVVLAFIPKAEKLLRKMFGLDKASTSSAFSGAAAGSMLASAISKAGSKAGGKASGGKNGGNSDSGTDGGESRVPTRENPYEAYEGDGDNQQETNNDEEQGIDSREARSLELDEERKNTESERQALDGFLDEGTDPNSDWSEDDYRAYQEQEQDERERALEEQEEQERLRQQEEQEDSNNNEIAEPEAQEEIEDTVQDANEKNRSSRIKGGFKALGGKGAKKVGDITGIRKSHFNAIRNADGHKARAKALGRMTWDGFKTMAPKVLEKGSKFTLGATAGLVAGSAALISGDPKSILSATAIATKGGGAIGSKAAKKLVSDTSSVSGTFMKGYYGNDYTEVKNKQEDYRWENSQKTDDDFRESFGDNWKEAKAVALEMRQTNGISGDNNKALIDALSMTSEFGGEKVKQEEALSIEEAMNMPLLSKKIPDSIFDDKKKYVDQRDRIQRELANKGINEGIAKQRAEQCLRDIAKFKGKTVPVTDVKPARAPRQTARPRQTPNNTQQNSETNGSTRTHRGRPRRS